MPSERGGESSIEPKLKRKSKSNPKSDAVDSPSSPTPQNPDTKISKSKPKNPQNPDPNPADSSSSPPQKPNPKITKSPKSAAPMAGNAALPDPLKGDPAATYHEDMLAILKGALEFKSRTGAVPKSATRVAFFESLKGLINVHLTEEDVMRKLILRRDQFYRYVKYGRAKMDDLVYRLSAELWQVNSDNKKENNDLEKKRDKRDNEEKTKHGKAKKMKVDGENEEEEELYTPGGDKKVVKKGKIEDNGREGALRIESLSYVKQALTEYCEANGLSSLTLEEGLKLVDPVKARALEEEWKGHWQEEMKLLLDWSTVSQELLASLYNVHTRRKR